MDPQLSLLPFDSPANVLLTLEHLVTRITRLAPDLGKQDVLLLLGELALSGLVVDSIEVRLRRLAQEHARRFALIA